MASRTGSLQQYGIRVTADSIDIIAFSSGNIKLQIQITKVQVRILAEQTSDEAHYQEQR